MQPKTYRKRPIEIEAVRYNGPDDLDTIDRLVEWTGAIEGLAFTDGNGADTVPVFVPRPELKSKWGIEQQETFPPEITAVVYDKLHSTWVGVKDGDYIIKGLQGEFYPHDGDLFPKAYEEVE